MKIRPAHLSDIPRMIDVVCRSITELCTEHYFNDPEILARWLSNKTSANFERWITDGRYFVVVAELALGLMGVGLMRDDGEVQLNYVSPDSRFQGVSKALILAMEKHARALGLHEVRLQSTQIASRMYASLGYETLGELESRLGTRPGISM